MSSTTPQFSGHSIPLPTDRNKTCHILGRLAALQFKAKGNFLQLQIESWQIILQILLCQGAGVACPGIYPLVTPSNGYRGQLAWMQSLAAIGPSAFKLLLYAAKEGELCLPRFIEIKLVNGEAIQLGPDLLTPGSSQLSRHPSLSLTIREEEFEVAHAAWNVKDCELGELLDSDEDVNLDCDAETVILNEKRAESSRCILVGKTLKVTASGNVKQEQLENHFSDFGDIEKVEIDPDKCEESIITFKRTGVAHHLNGHEHQLHEGQVRLRLKGGEGRGPAPSRQQQHNLNPFR